jgi:hypothetical protein
MFYLSEKGYFLSLLFILLGNPVFIINKLQIWLDFQNKHRVFSIHSEVSILDNGNVTQVADRQRSYVLKSLKERSTQPLISQ